MRASRSAIDPSSSKLPADLRRIPVTRSDHRPPALSDGQSGERSVAWPSPGGMTNHGRRHRKRTDVGATMAQSPDRPIDDVWDEVLAELAERRADFHAQGYVPRDF